MVPAFGYTATTFATPLRLSESDHIASQTQRERHFGGQRPSCSSPLPPVTSAPARISCRGTRRGLHGANSPLLGFFDFTRPTTADTGCGPPHGKRLSFSTFAPTIGVRVPRADAIPGHPAPLRSIAVFREDPVHPRGSSSSRGSQYALPHHASADANDLGSEIGRSEHVMFLSQRPGAPCT